MFTPSVNAPLGCGTYDTEETEIFMRNEKHDLGIISTNEKFMNNQNHYVLIYTDLLVYTTRVLTIHFKTYFKS